MPCNRGRACVAIVCASACGARTGLTDGRDARDAATTPEHAPAVADCRVLERFTLARESGDAFPLGLALNGDEVGLLYMAEMPRRILFGRTSLAAPGVVTPVRAGETPVLTRSGIVAFHRGFLLAFSDFADVPAGHAHAITIEDGAVTSDVRFGGAMVPDGVVPARMPDGSVALAWGEQLDGTTFDLKLAVTTDGVTLSAPTVLAHGPERPSFVSATASRDALGIAWVARTGPPDHTAVRFARVDATGALLGSRILVAHERYVYETSLAFGSDRFLLASTDSRADIGRVPLYVTTLAPDGSTVREGVRLTTDYGYESGPALAWGGNAFALVAVPFMDAPFGNEEQVTLRELDRDGTAVRGPGTVSAATLRESDCCVRATSPRIVSFGAGRYLVAWAEHERAGDALRFVVRAARLGCVD